MTSKELNAFVYSKLIGTTYKVFPLQGENPPFIVYNQISNTGIPTLEGTNLYNNYTYRIDVWSKTFTESQDMKESVLKALTTSKEINVSLQGTQEFQEEDLFRCSILFKIWTN